MIEPFLVTGQILAIYLLGVHPNTIKEYCKVLSKLVIVVIDGRIGILNINKNRMGMEKILPTPEQRAEAEGHLTEAQQMASVERADFLSNQENPEEMIELLKDSDLEFRIPQTSFKEISGKIKGHEISIMCEEDYCQGTIDGIHLDKIEAINVFKKYVMVAQRQTREKGITEESIKTEDEKLANASKKASALADIL